MRVHGTLEQLIAIADRIDAQFARICEQQELVLQDTINEMQDENRKVLNEANDKLAKAEAECRMYRDLLNDEAREYTRHMEATDSMYASFNEVFEAIERLL